MSCPILINQVFYADVPDDGKEKPHDGKGTTSSSSTIKDQLAYTNVLYFDSEKFDVYFFSELNNVVFVTKQNRKYVIIHFK